MIVCSCFGITDGEVREAMRQDNPGLLAAGTCCGSCLPLVSDIVRSMKDDEPRTADRDSATPSRDIGEQS